MDEHGLTARQRTLSLAAIFASNAAFGLAFGGLAPVIALTLEGRGVAEGLIGLNSSMAAIGVVTMTTVMPAIVRTIGMRAVLFLFSVELISVVALLPSFASLTAWLGLRFLIGVGIAGPWIVSETWLNEITPDRIRGRVMAIYATTLAAGFALGPAVVALVGTSGAAPFYFCATVMAVALTPLMLVVRWAPERAEVAEKSPIRGMWFAAPSIFGAALLAGSLDTTVFSLMPVWGLRSGLPEAEAVTALSVFVAGNLLLQFPIGWVGDRFGRRFTLILCGLVAAAGPVVTSLAVGTWAMLPVMFVWGGFGWALYSVALAMLGERYRGGAIAGANAAFIMAFEIANIVSPPIAGTAMDLWEPHGLMAFMALAALAFTVLVSVRGLVRRARGLPGE